MYASSVWAGPGVWVAVSVWWMMLVWSGEDGERCEICSCCEMHHGEVGVCSALTGHPQWVSWARDGCYAGPTINKLLKG